MEQMNIPLLITKLYIPPRRPRERVVSRPRLIERLDEGLDWGRKLTLVSAPAGFGKTTLLCEWIARSPARRSTRFAWLSLDENDDDLLRFLTYLCAALLKIDLDLQDLVAALRSPPPEIDAPWVEAMLTDLLNALAAQDIPLALVLDDVHLLQAPPIHDALTFLLDHLPPTAHLAIATRADPPLPLSRLRARGQITEIRQHDLQFTPEEVAAFLAASAGLHLAAPEIDALSKRTEGWIAGLQLVVLAMQSNDASGAARFIDTLSGRHHLILDYLTGEVLKQQPESIQRFLLHTSILKRLCGPLCAALLQVDETEGLSILEQLEHANLFLVGLDDERHWYRYHRLFADLLRVRLDERFPGLAPELYRRAAHWCDEQHLPIEAIDYALRANEHEWAADRIERTLQDMSTWSNADTAILTGWLNALPVTLVQSRPRLWLTASRILYITGRQQETARILTELERTLRGTPATPETEMLLGMLTADRASYAAVRGQVRQAIDLAQQALAYLPQNDPVAGAMRMRVASTLGLAHFRAGNLDESERAFREAITAAHAADVPFATTLLACNLADIQLLRGQLRLAMQTCRQAMQVGSIDDEPKSITGYISLEMGKILYEQNDLASARRHVVDGLGRLERAGTPDSFGVGHALLARIDLAQGDGQAGITAIEKAQRIAARCHIPRLIHLIAAHRAHIWLAQGHLVEAARWADGYQQLGESEYLREFEDLTLARVWLAQSKPVEALSLLDARQPPAQAAGRIGAVLEMLILRALARDAQGDPKGAQDALNQALDQAAAEGYVRLFVDEGAPMQRLLRRAERSAYVNQLLAAFEPGRAGQPAQPVIVAAQPLIEPLTDRELEVLALLAEGLTNAQIARRLVISLPTVKSHTRNLYARLDVHSRTQAVDRARALGLLPL